MSVSDSKYKTMSNSGIKRILKKDRDKWEALPEKSKTKLNDIVEQEMTKYGIK